MTITYDDVLEGLHERFAAVEGITTVISYIPTSIEPVTLFPMFERYEGSEVGQVLTERFWTRHYLCFLWQDNEQAEIELRPYIALMPAAIRADPHLGGRINSGWAKVSEMLGAFITIGSIDYRTLEIVTEVLVKQPVVRS